MTARTTPPFRADHVGSLLRPAAVKEARAKLAAGAISAAELKAIGDREIERLVKRQEEIGLQLATDGELRRSWWHFDFYAGLDGVELYETGQGIQFAGVATKSESIRIVGRVGFSGHPQIDHFRFLKSKAHVTAKMCIPAPGTMHFRQGRQAISRDIYPDLYTYFADVAAAYKGAVRAFYDVGCRYLQFDETAWAMMCSPFEREQSKKRGDDPDTLPARYARMTNTALADKPADLVVTMHSCRGNFRSKWIAEGGYEPVAERMFKDVNVDGYFLEWETERAGGLEPLRYVPKGKKIVVLGLISSKLPALENKDDIKRRIDEATKYVALDQLALSPQCGFASTEEGNVLTEEEQWAKLRLVVEIAREVWG
ncbi:MAG TPA: 5-methyltetrahydropteroyltriglutamate--homocysteine S-methyltransferase [Xanthobacteraceae bacterium]|nr:5-methyltetrahydropteroyltriglutamate--homocysteine S-methyltransferase [Xanthobacteraceae bacterium]